MLLAACDPGQSGAIAFYDTVSGELNVYDMPTHKRGTKGKVVVDVPETHALFAMYRDMGAQWLFVEAVGGLPGQSAPAAFIFGEGYGAVCAAALIAGFRLERIPPATWKAAMRVPADKAAALTRASELIPTHTRLWDARLRASGTQAQRSGRAEAAMLVLYGERILKQGHLK